MKKRKKKKKERSRPAVASSHRRALADRWDTLAQGWPEAAMEEARERLVSEARSLACEAGGAQALTEALRRSEPARAVELLEVASAAGSGELVDALGGFLRSTLPVSVALGVSRALAACGEEPDEALQEALGLAEEAAERLLETLESTGEPEAILEAATPLDGLDEAAAAAGLLEVFSRIAADGWLGASRLAGRSPAFDTALVSALEVAALPGAEALPLLKRLAASEVKTTSKRARALIHKLRSKGVDVDAEGEAVVWSPPASELGPGEALLTGFDQSGHQMVWLAHPAHGRGFDVAYGIISDAEGLLSFSWGNMPKKKLSEVKEELADEHAKREIPLVEVEPGEAARRLTAAASIAQSRGMEVPEDYRAYERQHPPPPEGAEAAIREEMSPEALERARHSTSLSPSLLDDPRAGVAFWRIEAEAMARAVEPEAEQRLIVAPSAPKVAEAEEAAAVCDRLFSGEFFQRLLARMEEQAFVFWKACRQEHATLCMACVLPFRDDPLMKPSAHPFWRLWAERLLQAHKASAQAPGAEGRLIVTPEEAAAEAQAARRRFMPGGRRRR